MDLCLKRAQAVKDALVERGVAADHVDTKGSGAVGVHPLTGATVDKGLNKRVYISTILEAEMAPPKAVAVEKIVAATTVTVPQPQPQPIVAPLTDSADQQSWTRRECMSIAPVVVHAIAEVRSRCPASTTDRHRYCPLTLCRGRRRCYGFCWYSMLGALFTA
jgi:hypothetical protein